MSDEEDLGAMAWPGFVDILSSVIIMFVFFVLIVASALFFHMLIFKSELEADLQALAEQKVQQEENKSPEEIVREIQELHKKLEEMKVSEDTDTASEFELRQMGAQFSETKKQKIEKFEDQDVIENHDKFIIYFGNDSISVTEETATEMFSIIESYGEKYDLSKIKIEIMAAKNKETQNETLEKKLAVSRALNVRNMFLDSNIDMKSIDIKTSSELAINGSYHWVMITFQRE